MSMAVGLGCLVIVAVLKGVTGGFVTEDYSVNSRSGPCSFVGGKCQSLNATCIGVLRPRAYCYSDDYDKEQVCCIPRGCVLGEKSYPDKALNEDSCMVMQCVNGDWKYTGHIRSDCGNCTVWGDPHFWTFDKNDFLPHSPYNYEFGGVVDFVITQQGWDNSSLFGVNSVFRRCNSNHASDVSCVQSVRYYEPGLTVDLILPELTTTNYTYCTHPDVNPFTDPKCKIKVIVNNEERQIHNLGDFFRRRYYFRESMVDAFHGTDGTVLVFEHNHIGWGANIICMNIVGSKGLSVSLCQHQRDFAWFYVFPMQSLKSKPSQLYGLCNTFTGDTRNNFTLLGGSVTDNVDTFANSWKQSGDKTEVQSISKRSTQVATNTSRCDDSKILTNIIKECKSHTEQVCNEGPTVFCTATQGACVFDVCRMDDHYLEGYTAYSSVCSHIVGGCNPPIPFPFCLACGCNENFQIAWKDEE